MVHHQSATVRHVRAEYFRRHNLGEDGGYNARWARFRVGPLTFVVPNTAARRRALPFHDLHHIATGYDTSWKGEGEIAAWELASGCGRYSAAWLLNFAAFFTGVLIAPRRVWRAFRAGRMSRSLYSEPWSDTWLDDSVASLQARLRIGAPRDSNVGLDSALFIACALPGLATAGVITASVLFLSALVPGRSAIAAADSPYLFAYSVACYVRSPKVGSQSSLFAISPPAG